ncbi:MAG: FAD-dependent oxidoreductase [Deltaproteobacteria bacterium]|nr:FAD-dependent oxidoreductase [Deltaproteobacteria bacterium]
MLRVGIPDYRLPPEVLDQEIDHILSLGVKTRTGVRFGPDFTFEDLKAEGFAAVFLGIGAHNSLDMGIAGEKDTQGVIDAVRFLREVNLGNKTCPGSRVVVIGGGNVAIDAARVVKRLGAREVTVVYRRSEEEMPAYAEEIEGAVKEEIRFSFLTAPVKVIAKDVKVDGFECIRTELGPPDDSGRRRPMLVDGSEFIIPCDAVIPAIGQKIDTSWAAQVPDLKWTLRNTLDVNPQTMQSSIPYVFAGGDMVTGPDTVIQAVAAGYKAVKAIHRYINGEDLELYAQQLEAQEEPGRDWQEIPDGISREARTHQQHLDAKMSAACFDEVDLGFSESGAQQEARRCLNCGVCCECMECVKVCEAKSIDHNMQPEELEVKVGSIIVATGYDIMDPAPMKQFGYGKYPNVFTSLEFERLSNATGPTGGEIFIRDENGDLSRTPKSVAILHCIGSRDVHYHEYCSRVCCMYALKYGHLIHEKVGHDIQVYNFYIDMRCFGKGYEEFYKRCQEEGTNFIRGKVAEITDQAIKPEEEGKLVAIAEDTLLGRRLRIPVDMVVLCVAMQARSDAKEMGRIFGVNLGADGFFMEEHPKLAPLETATAGVFLAGACQGPKDIPDTVSQASGAAVKALALATLGEVEIAPVVSWIDSDVCAGCQICIGLCPYTAIEYNARTGVSVVNEALCKGCGSCAGFCPSGAAQVKHFNEKQLFAELEGIVDSLYFVGM